MKSTLIALKPQLESSAQLTAQTMKKIENENLSVETATILVKRDEDAANIQAEISGQLKEECEADLAEALPVLEEAIGKKKATGTRILTKIYKRHFRFL